MRLIAMFAAILLLPRHDDALIAAIQVVAMCAIDEQVNNLCGMFR